MKTQTLLNLVGNTPLITLNLNSKAKILAKLEYLNPGGSIKDRSALFMVEKAEKEGILQPGGTIIEASSGNQGIALAMIGALKGYRVIITVPQKTSIEKISLLKAYGAEVIVCPDTASLEDPENYHVKAKQLAQEISNSFMPNQYFNSTNLLAHYHTTGPEIWEQTKGKITYFFTGTGSCGTISGVGRYLKEKNPKIQIIGIDSIHSAYSAPKPEVYHVEGIGIDVITENFDQTVIDKIETVTDDEAITETKRLIKNGHLVGLSSGAVMYILNKYLPSFTKDDVVVVIFADSGKSYLSKLFPSNEEKK